MIMRWVAPLALAMVLCGDGVLAQTQSGQEAGAGLETAVFAGGCFWCVEEAFDKVDGVEETTSGYIGGTVADPTYEQVTRGNTGHAEAVRVRYRPDGASYEELLDTFWRNIDPFDGGGQFCDRGSSYRSAIFPVGDEQRRLAEKSKEEVAERLNSPRRIATEIEPEAEFYTAEDYHQDYYLRNPVRYKFYKWNCGRAQRLEEIWGPPSG